MKVLIKKFVEEAKLPYKKHADDFCYDLYATSVEEVSPGVLRYHTGIGMQIVRDWEKFIGVDSEQSWSMDFRKSPLLLSVDIRPRSSVYKTGLVLCNAEPTVDEGYTGEIQLTFYHVMKDLKPYEPGDRIAQMKIGFTVPCDFEVVCELYEKERGEDGFGSTGKN